MDSTNQDAAMCPVCNVALVSGVCPQCGKTRTEASAPAGEAPTPQI